jgi:hypothetical protein
MNLRDKIAIKVVAAGVVTIAMAGELAKQSMEKKQGNKLATTKLNIQVKELEAKLNAL